MKFNKFIRDSISRLHLILYVGHIDHILRLAPVTKPLQLIVLFLKSRNISLDSSNFHFKLVDLVIQNLVMGVYCNLTVDQLVNAFLNLFVVGRVQLLKLSHDGLWSDLLGALVSVLLIDCLLHLWLGLGLLAPCRLALSLVSRWWLLFDLSHGLINDLWQRLITVPLLVISCHNGTCCSVDVVQALCSTGLQLHIKVDLRW